MMRTTLLKLTKFVGWHKLGHNKRQYMRNYLPHFRRHHKTALSLLVNSGAEAASLAFGKAHKPGAIDRRAVIGSNFLQNLVSALQQRGVGLGDARERLFTNIRVAIGADLYAPIRW